MEKLNQIARELGDTVQKLEKGLSEVKGAYKYLKDT